MSHIVRPLVVALVATIGDYIWFEYGVRHTTTAGIVHGAALLLAVGFILGHAAGALARGSMGGIVAGVAGALAYYGVAGTLGYLGGLIAAWAFMWLVLAAINAWLRHTVGNAREWLVRGAVAAVASGAAFYLVAGIWTDRPPEGGRNYVWHLVAWTIAWAPGLMALTLTKPKA
jgi:hypothetical protein